MIVKMMIKSQLEIHLLGAAEIKFDQKPIHIPRRVERIILYVLAAENHPVSRMTLIDLLWPEADQVDPRGTLRTALSRLRKNLPDADLLVTDHDLVTLDFDRCQVDLLGFENAFLSLQGILPALAKNKALPAQIVRQITQALALWHGDSFIQGKDLSTYPELEIWRQTLNKTVSHHREILMQRLADHYQACGQLERALDLFIQLGRLNYLEPQSHLSAIDTLTKLGRFNEVLEFCDALEAIFEREYNAPLPDEIIKRCHYSQLMLDANQRKVGTDWPIPGSMHFPLVGRTEELGLLRQAFFRGGLVIIQGEMGTGKTRLVRELYEILAPKPILILASGSQIENALPLAPLIHGVRGHVPQEVWKELDTVWAQQLSIIFPELIEIRADCNPSVTGKLASARHFLFDALLQLLNLTAKNYGRMLFFLDNGHWVDQQTLQALSYLLLQGFFDQHGVLIIASRVEEINRYIDDLVDQHQHSDSVQFIDMSGLNPDELRTLTQQALSQPPSRALVEHLYRQTKGIPFLALEIIRDLLEKPGDIEAFQKAEQLPLPASVHALIRSRLNRLSEQERYILTCAAVIGHDVKVDFLHAVSDLRQNEFLIALDPLIRSGFLSTIETDHGKVGALIFTHDMMREVVIKETSPAHLQMLHQRVAIQLAQSTQPQENHAKIADHFLSAGDEVNAFNWFLKAGVYAWSLGGRDEVLYAYQQAESLINKAQKDLFDTKQIFQLYKQWGDFAYQSDQPDMLEEVGVKLQYHAQLENNPLLLGLSNLILSTACFIREDFETGLMLIQKAIKDLETTEDAEALIKALFQKTHLLWWILDYDSVHTTANQMLTIICSNVSDSEKMKTYEFNAQRVISETLSAQGEATKALHTAQKNYQAFYHQLGTFDKLRACNMMARSHFTAGQLEDCIQFAQKGFEIVKKLENTFFEGVILTTLCKGEIVRGHLDEAYQHANRALKFAESNNKVQTLVAANTVLGDIFIILNNYPLALQYYRIAQVRQGFFFQSYHGLENNIHLARLLTWSGQLREARELLHPTLEITEQKGMAQLYLQALLIDGLCDLLEKKFHDAEKKFSSIINVADQKGLHQEALWGEFLMARMQIFKHQFEHAQQHLLALLDKTQSQKMILLSMFTMGLYSQLNQIHPLKTSPEHLKKSFDAILEELKTHTQLPPLKQDFAKTLQYWQEQHPFP